ncbi:hypothetical protein PHYSODRAFT_510865, partial [Phytophthora sojae]
TLLTSSKVTPDKLQKWLDEGKSAETVFARMRLKKAGGWLLYRPQFTEWLISFLRYESTLGQRWSFLINEASLGEGHVMSRDEAA